MSYLKEVMKDYRSEVQDVLSADRQLASEIEFDLKRFDEQQKELEEQRRKQTTPRNSPQVCGNISRFSVEPITGSTCLGCYSFGVILAGESGFSLSGGNR